MRIVFTFTDGVATSAASSSAQSSARRKTYERRQ
jgi:hypothetical protein